MPQEAEATRTVHAVCSHDCPDSCGVLVTVDSASGRAIKLQGDPAHPVTRGFLCGKVAKYLDRVYSPDRLLHPMRRRPGAPKGPAGYGHAKGREADAETAPLRHPEQYRYDFDLPAIAELWRRGSVVSSWLLDLCAQALLESPGLDGFTGAVSDSGEGRWTVNAAIDEGVPAHVLSGALYNRFASRGHADFADRLLSAMRHSFGGHQEKPAAREVSR